jgi:TFIIF-interacting CTD phosphatase-like protein
VPRCKHTIKDLRILNRDLKNCAIVDNLVASFLGQLDNGIPIAPFTGDACDTELQTLLLLLDEMSRYDDLRCALKQKYYLTEILKLLK